ncbi:hypothetical protein ThvES_00006060 [Thiovulum sp. ES]|nr:hypothetical protein ThvES_00006060 [Thiovulum sp. ES]
MELFSELEKILEIENAEQKCLTFDKFYLEYKNGNLLENHEMEIQSFQKPSYQKMLDVVLPSKVKSRRKLNTIEGQASLLHSIIHIEYSAIDLALDHSYRFRNLPKSYYDDWLEVAKEEISHFRMLVSLLDEIGFSYGDFPVHDNLFLASKKTENSLASRMSVVPRFLEASGLDSNPLIMEKLNSINTEFTRKIVDALQIILDEEISHVQKGDKWFEFACEKENFTKECYFSLVKDIYPTAFDKGKNINREARENSGFSEKELDFISGDGGEIPICNR